MTPGNKSGVLGFQAKLLGGSLTLAPPPLRLCLILRRFSVSWKTEFEQLLIQFSRCDTSTALFHRSIRLAQGTPGSLQFWMSRSRRLAWLGAASCSMSKGTALCFRPNKKTNSQAGQFQNSQLCKDQKRYKKAWPQHSQNCWLQFWKKTSHQKKEATQTFRFWELLWFRPHLPSSQSSSFFLACCTSLWRPERSHRSPQCGRDTV